MNSIIRALLARWPLIAVSTIACLLGGLWVATTSAPRYQGHARVVLDYIRPDPVTGEVVTSKMLDAYLASQIRMLRDQSVAGNAAELMGWMDSPDVLAAYAARPASDTRDFASWVGSILIPRIGARMIDDSNIMEISYFGESEEISRVAAEALRTAYVESNIQARQEAARSSAERIQESIARVRTELAELESMQAGIEQQSGITLGARGLDSATNQLRELVAGPQRPVILGDSTVSPTQGQIIQLDAEIARLSKSLGPNNPNLKALLAQREWLRVQALSEGSLEGARSTAIQAAARASTAQFEALKAQVFEAREPALRLRLLQDQINAREAEFRHLTETLVALRGLQTVNVSTKTPIGEAYAEPTPVFPNDGLILGGTGALGFVLGSILACLAELLGRRIRTPRHLEAASGVVILAQIPDTGTLARRRRSVLRREPLDAVSGPAVDAMPA
jgi:succinoglycan biosynthesis transport protein ExoP